MPDGHIVLVVVEPSAHPGQLTWAGWVALREARAVYVESLFGTGQWDQAMTEAGLTVQTLCLPVEGRQRHQLTHSAREPAGVAVLVCEPAPGEAASTVRQLTEVATSDGLDITTVVGARGDGPSPLAELVSIVDTLRTRCPWDREQTHRSLMPHLLEETYEVLDAVADGEPSRLREELGDLLGQVVLHARIAEELSEPWSLGDVARGVAAKLVRRHPHVFGDLTLTTAEQVDAAWESFKDAEGPRKSIMDGVPVSLPALSLAAKMIDRAAKRRLTVPLRTLPRQWADLDATGIGEALLALVALAGRQGTDPEVVLRTVVRQQIELVDATNKPSAHRPDDGEGA